jgi:hypothetical protein
MNIQNLVGSELSKEDMLMRSRLLGPIILLMLILMLFSAVSSVSAEVEVPHKDALDSGDVSGRFVSKGAASGHVADLTVESNTPSDITLDLANSGLEGMVLVNPYDGEQDEVITETPGIITQGTFFIKDNITLKSGESVKVAVIGYCMNFDLATPTLNVQFDLSTTSDKTSINEIDPVIDTLRTYEFPEGWTDSKKQETEQMAIWTSQQSNKNVPHSRYSGRGYTIDDEQIQVVSDILNKSGKDASDVAALTGIEKVDDGLLDILDEIPWFVIVLIIVAIILAGIIGGVNRARKRRKNRKRQPSKTGISAYEKYENKKRECEKLSSKCKEAYNNAEEAQETAKSADERAEEAEKQNERATSEREQAELELEEFQRDKKEDEETYAESDGKRVTSYDLKLKNEASKVVWKEYQDGEIDAETLQNVWKDLGEIEALDILRKRDKNDREIPLKDALEKAKLNEEEAKKKARSAREYAGSTKDYAKRAKDHSNKLCQKAHDCQEELRKAAEEAGVKDKKKKPSKKPKESKKETHEKEGGPDEDFEEPEIDDDDDDKDDEIELDEDVLEEMESDEKKDRDSD